MTLNIPLSQRSLPLVSAMLALCVGSLLIYSLWRWQSDWRLAHQTIVAEPTLNTADETTAMIAAIPDDHLFGKAYVASGDVPVTDLQLTVTGIVKIHNEEGASSKVYISSSGNPSKIYQVGDTLPQGVKVYEITGDAVILENNGRLEKLLLPREPLQFKPAHLKEQS